MVIASRCPFGQPEEDPFLLLESSLHCRERILQGAVGHPLQRSWIEHPYGEEELTLLKEVLPVLQEWLALVDAIDAELLEQQREREALAAQGVKRHQWEETVNDAKRWLNFRCRLKGTDRGMPPGEQRLRGSGKPTAPG
jgi:hypothetical protein